MDALSGSRYICPACGYDGLEQLPWSMAEPSDEICPSCGIHFGYDDAAGGDVEAREAAYLKWREQWKAKGMQWFSNAKDPPPEWDPIAQLQRVERAA